MKDSTVVTQLHDIPIRKSWIPLRAHFGIASFGVNAYHGAKAGDRVIGKHVETQNHHEELYLVIEGHATFTVDDEEIEAPLGTIVYVGDPASWRSAVAKVPETTVLVVGARPGHVFTVSPWEETWRENQDAFRLYEAGRYDEAATVLREALKAHPNAAGLLYNLACYDSMAGRPAETVAESLGRAIELNSGFREFARGDTDFDRIRDEPPIRELVGDAVLSE